jgi:hypothetical protein
MQEHIGRLHLFYGLWAHKDKGTKHKVTGKHPNIRGFPITGILNKL